MSHWPLHYQPPTYFVLTIGVAVSLAGGASAQTMSDQPLAAPFFGNTPNVGNNQPRFSLVPSIRTAYNTNVLRNDDLDGPRDNVRVTPGIDLNYQRQFGRVALGVSGSAGYDLNSRFRFLDQSRIDFNGSAQAPLGSVCSITAEASYNKLSFDLNDTQADAGSTSTIQVYDVFANCQRRGGFTPVGRFTYRSTEADQSAFFNYRQYTESLGLAYAQPSLGTITLNAIAMQMRRPDLYKLTGFNDNTNIYTLSLGLDRAISPRIQLSARAGATKVKPKRASVPSFLGASYSGQVRWLPTPRFNVVGTAAREVTSQSGISATYVIRKSYALSAGLQVSAKSRIGLTGSRNLRDFRGGDLTPALQPLRTDQTSAVAANYSYDVSRRLRIGFALSHRWRKADNAFYDYKSTALSTSIGAHF